MSKNPEKIEDWLCEYFFIICLIISSILEFLYYFRDISNIKEAMSDIITLSSVIFVVLSLILTLFIALKESELFKRINKNFSYINEKIYKFSIKVIFAAMFVLILAIIVKIIPSNIMKVIKFLISFIGLFSFCYMFLGTMYLLKFVTDMVIRSNEFEKNKKKRRE